MGYKGIDYLRNKLSLHRQRVLTRYDYYHQKISTGCMASLNATNGAMREVLGWCTKAVDTLADRLDFDTFDNDNFNVNQIFTLNNRDVLIDSAILSAAIASCSFVSISAASDGYPRLQVIDGGNATGVIDLMTGLLTEGYAVLERDEYQAPKIEAYYTAGKTTYYRHDGTEPFVEYNKSPYAMLVPIIYRPDAVRPFGHSRISRACMDATLAAQRTLTRSETSAEFYSYPQKYVLGLSEDAEFNNRLASASSFLRFDKDSDGDKPTVGQFTTQSMTPYAEQLKLFASIFAAETGLTLDDLGFTTSNPSSAEAIKASHENLRLTTKKAQHTFGIGLLNVGYLACCLRDNTAYDRKVFADIKPIWQPIFEPDAAALSGVGDAILKINQAVPDYLGAKNIKHLTGMESDKDV